MHHFTQRTLTAMAALAASALAAGAAAPAHAAASPGTVTANDADGITYTASDDSSKIHITQQGYLVVDDTVPLKAGAGCVPVVGDPTQAWCLATVAKRFTVSAAGGNDTVTNHTSLQMTAHGGIGDDSLYGGAAADTLNGGAGDDQLRGDGGNDQLVGGSDSDSLDGSGGADTLVGGGGDDTLRGGTGDNDHLDGGAGADVLNGGDGEHDRISYEFRTKHVVVYLAQPNDSVSIENGESGEKDQITQVEDVRGSAGSESIVGNERDNRLDSYAGSHSGLYGFAGADVLVGSNASDTLSATGLLGWGWFHDGAQDELFAGGGSDACSFSPTDPDFVDQCE
jgi:Ca2+-binding RTX toxin-like protein